MEAIIRKAEVCRLGMSRNNRPYIVPLCFGYQDHVLYFHSAPKGEKIDILKENNQVCFEIDIEAEIVEADVPCKWGMRYLSIIGFGRAYFIEDHELKKKALDIIMQNYSNRQYLYEENVIQNTAVFKVEIDGMTGKQSGHSSKTG